MVAGVGLGLCPCYDAHFANRVATDSKKKRQLIIQRCFHGSLQLREPAALREKVGEVRGKGATRSNVGSTRDWQCCRYWASR